MLPDVNGSTPEPGDRPGDFTATIYRGEFTSPSGWGGGDSGAVTDEAATLPVSDECIYAAATRQTVAPPAARREGHESSPP